MKNLRSFIIILGVAVVFLTSCDKETETDFITPVVSAKINGEDYTTNFKSSKIENGIILVFSSDNPSMEKGKTMTITINGTEPGTYKQWFDHRTGVSVTHCRLIYRIQNDSTRTYLNYLSYEGEVKISSIDRENKLISGIFSFKGRTGKAEFIEITEGKFLNVKYQ